MNTKHTPGPWIARVGDDPAINPPHPNGGTFRLFPHVEIGMRGSQPDTLTINAGGGPLEEHDANARLIAAAPKMLATLQQIMIEVTESPNCDAARIEVIEQLAREAIAEVDGGAA